MISKGITRADIVGAIKLLDAVGIEDKRAALHKMLLVEHSEKETAKALGDLSSYPEWTEPSVEASSGADAAVAKPRRVKKA